MWHRPVTGEWVSEQRMMFLSAADIEIAEISKNSWFVKEATDVIFSLRTPLKLLPPLKTTESVLEVTSLLPGSVRTEAARAESESLIKHLVPITWFHARLCVRLISTLMQFHVESHTAHHSESKYRFRNIPPPSMSPLLLLLLGFK